MNAQEEIEKKQREIEILKNQQEHCSHTWNEAKYDPETKNQLFPTGKLVGPGSDPHDPGEWRPVTTDRWSQTCTKCGKKEYTYEQEVVKVDRKPKFR